MRTRFIRKVKMFRRLLLLQRNLPQLAVDLFDGARTSHAVRNTDRIVVSRFSLFSGSFPLVGLSPPGSWVLILPSLPLGAVGLIILVVEELRILLLPDLDLFLFEGHFPLLHPALLAVVNELRFLVAMDHLYLFGLDYRLLRSGKPHEDLDGRLHVGVGLHFEPA